MANSTDEINPDPNFTSIMDAIEEISVLAKLNKVSSAGALSNGFTSPELKRKFIAFGDKLSTLSKEKVG